MSQPEQCGPASRDPGGDAWDGRGPRWPGDGGAVGAPGGRGAVFPVGLRPVAAAVAVTTAGLLPVFLTAALGIQLRHALGVGSRELGEAVAGFFGASALCTAPFGRLADGVGGVRLLRAAPALSGAALFAIATAVHTPLELIATLAAAGVANGAIQPAANHYLTEVVRSGRLGLAFGVKQAAIPAATLLSGLAVPTVAVSFGWRWAFGIGVVLAAASMVGVPGTGVPHGAAPRRPRPAAAGHAPGSGGQRPFVRRPLMVLAMGVAAGSAAGNALGAFFVVSAVHAGVADARAGLIAAAASMASALVRVGLGHQADVRDVAGTGGGSRGSEGGRPERGRRPRRVDQLRVVAGLCALGATGLALLGVGGVAVLIPAAVVGYALGWGWAGLLNFAVADRYPASPGRATGITQMGASTGACLGPLAFGVAATRYGYGVAWDACAVALLVAAALVLYGRALLQRSRAAA